MFLWTCPGVFSIDCRINLCSASTVTDVVTKKQKKSELYETPPCCDRHTVRRIETTADSAHRVPRSTHAHMRALTVIWRSFILYSVFVIVHNRSWDTNFCDERSLIGHCHGRFARTRRRLERARELVKGLSSRLLSLNVRLQSSLSDKMSWQSGMTV